MKKLLILTMMMLLVVTAFAAGMTTGAASTDKAKRFTLVIDAGHGGHDAGAVGAITKEKTINLNVALAFGRLVERRFPDVKVVYTRKTDVFIPLHERADIANRNKANLFISIHTNSLPRGRIARGLETYTLGMHRAADNLEVAKRENAAILKEADYKQRYQGFDPNSSESYIMFEFIQDKNMAQSVELARFVQQRTCASARRPDKGVKQAGFLVLRETSMPSCLIELGFISTRDEEQFLDSKSGVEQLASGIYQAFADYKNKYDKNITVPLRAETKQEVTIPTVVPQDGQKTEPRAAKKRRSKVAEELAEARDGQVQIVETAPQPITVNADSITMTDPIAPEKADPSAEKASPAPEKASPASEKADPSAEKANPSTEKATLSALVFKVQILASSTRLKGTDAQLKGQRDVDCYEEGGLFKYTIGASEDYNAVAQLRRQLLDKFPQAFVIAFKDGQKMNVQEAIREFKNRKVKK